MDLWTAELDEVITIIEGHVVEAGVEEPLLVLERARRLRPVPDDVPAELGYLRWRGGHPVGDGRDQGIASTGALKRVAACRCEEREVRGLVVDADHD